MTANQSGLTNARGYTDAAGRRFASYAEGARYAELEARERAGQIQALTREVPFPFVVNGIKVGSYRADAVYVERLDVAEAVYPAQRLDRLTSSFVPLRSSRITDTTLWQVVVEDTKGRRLKPYPTWRKLLLALYGLQIREISSDAYRAPRKPTERKNRRVSY